MSEAAILQVIASVITLIATSFAAWLAVHYKIQPIVDKTEHVIQQNDLQEKKIDKVNEHVTEVHTEINSRLSQYIKVAVEAALAQGVAEGIELERQRSSALAAAKKEPT